MPSAKTLEQALPKDAKLLVLDFDGVLTDNAVYVTEEGQEVVRCSREDGMGIELLQKNSSVKVLVLSKEKNPVVSARCKKIKVECIQGIDDKPKELQKIWKEKNVTAAQTVYVGNDINDLECLKMVGCALVVADAHPSVLGVAHAVLTKRGGNGAVREVCDCILEKLRG